MSPFRLVLPGLSLVFVSYLLRLGAGMVVMVLAARQLGPAEFGLFIYWMAVATLLTVPVNLGLGTYVLREMGVDRQRYASVMGAALSAKLLLMAAVLTVSAGMCALLPARDAAVFGCLLLAQGADSFGEFFNLGFRRDAQYEAEARCAVSTSSLHLLVMVAAIGLGGQALHAAMGFALSRVLGAGFTVWRSMAVAGAVRPAPIAQVPALMRANWAYAAELGLTTLYSQIDSLLVNQVLGAAGVGLYQAGMKLVDGACRLAPVLAQYLLPTLAAQWAQGPPFRLAACRAVGMVAGLGAVGAAALALGGDDLTHWLYGDRYHSLGSLMPLFALMLLLRYLETGVGLVLVAVGLQSQKVWLVPMQLAVVMSAGHPVMVHFGLPGWQVLVIAGLLGLLCAYGMLLARAHQHETENLHTGAHRDQA